MKLAEALSLRTDCQKKIEQLKGRITSNVKVQEGDEPSENPTELMKEMDAAHKQLQDLICKINEANIRIKGKDGRTMTQMLAERDVLKSKISALREIYNEAAGNMNRYSRSEIKMVCTVDVKALHKQIDKLSSQLRELDIEIQSLNFSTDL